MRFHGDHLSLADPLWLVSVIAVASLVGACDIPVSEVPLSPPVERDGPLVEIARFDNAGQCIETVETPSVIRNESAWRNHLNPLAFRVLREGETEFAYGGQYDSHYELGIYRCAGCNEALFDGATKYDSETGWPSFWAPIAKENVYSEFDDSWGVRRLKVRCSRCGGQLGHIFKDGPAPTYLRYCINSTALSFVSAPVQTGRKGNRLDRADR